MKDDSVNIAQILPSLEVGGQEVFVARLTAKLAERGWRVAAVGVTGSGPLEEDFLAAGVRVAVADSTPSIPGFPSGLIRTLRRMSPDVLHSHSGTWFPTAIAGRILGCRVVHTEHGRYPDEAWWVPWADRIAFALTDSVVVVSGALDADFRRRFRKRRPFRTIANGVTVPAVVSGAVQRARALLDVPSETIVVGNVGRLVPAKNHKALVDAVEQLVHQGHDVTLVLIGEGPLRVDLEQQVSERKLESRVRFLGHRADVAALLWGIDIYASSSSTEGTPIAVLEAMAAGRPIVATDVGGLRHLLDGGGAGILVPPGDQTALAIGLGTLIGDARRRHNLGGHARERAAQEFSLDAAVSQYEEIYRSLWK